MDFSSPSTWYVSASPVMSQALAQISFFLPRLIGALVVLLIGALVAKFFKQLVIKLFGAAKLSHAIKNTPIEHFFKDAEMGLKVEEVAATVVYWLIMLMVVQTTVTILGLEPLSQILSRIVNYLPNIITAILVLFFGTLLAGVIEGVVKGSIKTIDGHSSRVLGKVASYLVMSITVMAAVSELGIASEFIMILFVGFVAMLSIGFGLALGLGGQELVRKLLNTWYEKMLKEVSE